VSPRTLFFDVPHSLLRPTNDATRRAAPFALIIAVCALTPAVPHSPAPDSRLWLAAGFLIAAMFAIGQFGVVTRRAAFVDAAPLLLAPIVALLRAADGAGYSGFAPLLMLPILWYALYGTGRLLAVATAEAAITLLAPIVVVGAPDYPGSTLRGTLLLLAVMTSLGLIVQRLLTAAQAAHAKSAADAARFHGVFEYAPVGMALSEGAIDATTSFTLVNRTLCALLGRTPEALVGSTLSDLVHHQDLDDLVAHVSRGDGEPVEIRFVHRAGHIVWASLSCMSLRDAATAGTRYAWQIDDVTAQRAADASMLDMLDTERRTARALRDSEREQRQLLASISHDLRTPITAALGFAELLADGEYGGLSPTQQHTADVITRSLSNLSRIINELVVIGPELAGDESGPQERVMIAELVDDAIQMVSIQASLRNQSIRWNRDAAVDLCVHGDAVRLSRVFSNLLTNAVKFSPVDGKIGVRAAREGNDVVISVSDSGRGIAPVDQERIFERFYRAPHDTTDPTVRGSGLGLAIVKAIVSQHGGAVSLRSALGRGTTFTVRLPAVSRAAVSPVVARTADRSTLV
jgi:PAS domain S-box-containing protein